MRAQRAVILLVVVGILVALGTFLYLRTQDASPPPSPPPTSEPVPQPAETHAPSAPPEEPPAGPEEEPVEEAPPVEEPATAYKVYGTVMDAAQGAPIPGAVVFASTAREESAHRDSHGPESSPPDDAPQTKTDDTGAFAFEVTGEDWESVVCVADGYASAMHPLPSEPGADARVDFMMQPGSRISGRVTDAATGAGIAEVRVTATDTQQSFVSMMRSRTRGRGSSAKTGADGTYSISGLSLGSYRVSVRSRSKGYPFPSEKAVILDMKEGVIYENVDFALEVGAVVQGTVADAEGAPIADATVRAMPGQFLNAALRGVESMDMDTFMDLSNRTGDDGSFRIVGLDFDAEYRLRAEAHGYAEGISDTFRIPAGESPAEMTLVLMTGSRISGTARYDDGTAAPKRQIRLMPEMGSMLSGKFVTPKSTLTDEQGAFLFEGVSPGSYTVQSGFANPFAPLDASDETVAVEVDGVNPIEGIEVVVERGSHAREGAVGTGVIEGKVLSPAGAPVPKVRVEAAQANNPMVTAGAMTKEDGAFTLDGLASTPYSLSVTCDEGTAEQPGVMPGMTVTIRLSPPTVVSGVVVDRDGGPVASCRVSLKKQDREESSNPMAFVMRNMMGDGLGGSTTNAIGYFEFKNVSPGRYVVEAKSQDKGTGNTNEFSVTAGVDVSNLRITLDPGTQFRGTVENSQGRPVAGASVKLIPSAEDEMADFMSTMLPAGMQKASGSATSDAAGAFEINRVPPGVYTVVATHGSYAKHQKSGVAVPAGQGVSGYRIVLSEGGVARGSYMSDGAPREGVMIQFMGPAGMQMATTDSEGRFELGGLTPGAYLVNVVDMSNFSPGDGFAGLRSTTRVVDVVDGQTVELDLGADAGVTVSGTVTGEGLAGITSVSLRRPGGPLPEELDPFDMASTIEAARYSAGQAIVGQDGTFRIDGIEPGTYLLEVHSIDMDPLNPDFDAIMSMDRSPRIRQEIVVGTEPVHLTLEVPPR